MGVAQTVAGRYVVEPLLAALFPSDCPACGALVVGLDGPLCDACLADLPRHAGTPCGCGHPMPEGVPAPCGRCRRQLNPLPQGASLGPYDGTLRSAVLALKFGGQRRVAHQLAGALWAQPSARALLTPEALLVPVPLHPSRQRQRGFNQSELIARELARLGRLEVRDDVVVRQRDTATQTGLSAAGRRDNVASAFAVRRPEAVRGRVIVLVDDVHTTGATARACGRVLSHAGAASVRLLTAARTM